MTKDSAPLAMVATAATRSAATAIYLRDMHDRSKPHKRLINWQVCPRYVSFNLAARKIMEIFRSSVKELLGYNGCVAAHPSQRSASMKSFIRVSPEMGFCGRPLLLALGVGLTLLARQCAYGEEQKPQSRPPVMKESSPKLTPLLKKYCRSVGQTDNLIFDARPFLKPGTKELKTIPLEILEPDNFVAAQDYKSVTCLRWHDGVTQCERKTLDSPVYCGPFMIKGVQVHEPLGRTFCMWQDEPTQSALCASIGLGRETLPQQLVLVGDKMCLGEVMDPMEIHIDPRWRERRLSEQRYRELTERYGKWLLFQEFRPCVGARTHIDVIH